MSQDVEEGETDSASVKRVKKPGDDSSKVGSIFNSEAKQEKTRVWTMHDLYNYQMSQNNALGLYNLAWAQTVHNKPIHEVLVLQDHNTSSNKNKSNKHDGEADNGGGVNECSNDKVVIDLSSGDDDGEREEGELEDGEIDFNVSDSEVNKSEYDLMGNNKELEKRIAVIHEALESLITGDLEQSYNAVCFRLKNLLDSLWEVVFKDSGSNIGELIELAYDALNTLNNIFSSMGQKQQEQNKLSLSRLFCDVTSQNPPLFSTEQMTEIENMIKSLECGSSLPALGDNEKQNKNEKGDEAKTSIDSRKLETSSFKDRGLLLPLVDLHKDHDEDSHPSPTGDTPLIMPADNAVAVGREVIKPEWPAPLVVHMAEDVLMPSYASDALKAVCTYQQKFGQTSFHMSDLPSPTPSEDCGDGIGDTCGEVSSSPEVRSTVKTVTAPTLPQLNVSSLCSMDICSSEAVNNTKNIVSLKSSEKRRDPRLRFANANTVALRVSICNSVGENRGSKKQKPTDEPVSNGPTLKRQKNSPTDLGSAANSSSTGSSITNVMLNGLRHLPGNSTCNKSSLESILKELAVNPAILTNLYKMEQQKSVAYPVQNFMHVSSSSSELGAIPPVNVSLTKFTVVEQKSVEILQTPDPTVSTDKLEKDRMKLCDPRRALHNNTVQKVGSGGLNHIKTSAAPIPSYQEMEVGVSSCKKPDRKFPPLKNTIAPDITRQFTKDLKNIANIVSVTQIPTVPPVIPKGPSLPPSGDAPEPVNNQCGVISPPEEVSAGPSLSQNPWGDVEHLFNGLDEKQKVAFHKERARRIDEQKKMYAARKLCLVLDLDHTLLNSVKFLEVDPVHDEILRKKEEQDREKPYRHLFRFPHMGMWTKLRPGIWNFLEKASKLFELHLYTMGNTRYATEMAKLLDPKGTLFSGRVISRGDDDEDNDISKSKNLEGVLGMESGVVIIDDSIRVWPHNKLNLIAVERYIYFPCSRRQFRLLGPSLLEIDHDERPEVGTLASSLAVIERIHQNFFAHQSLDEADVRNILASEQRKILSGCRIVFSRVFPVGEANPHLHPLWQNAEQFGAICTNQIDEQVTHVVANSLGTDKVNWARSTGRFVVNPGWVEASSLLYQRANEQDFSVKP